MSKIKETDMTGERAKGYTKEYLSLISKTELIGILEMYGKDKKTIKRLCK